MKVLLLTRYGRLGASSRLRAYQYLPYLESCGFRVTTAPFFSNTHQVDLYRQRPHRWSDFLRAYAGRVLQLLRAPRFDLLWIEYELFPWLPALAERLVAGLGIPYVVDYDDAIYYRYQLHRFAGVRLLLGRKIDNVMRRASSVIVGNEYLGERARAAGARRVEELPTVVDLDRYSVRPYRPNAVMTIGWMGSPTTAGYLSLIAKPLAEFCRAGKGKVVVVGARQTPLLNVPVTLKEWSESTEVEDLMSFDVGVMPLPDKPWERAKCGYKLIQYMAAARPVIASPVGVNAHIVEHGINGFLASTDDEWRTALTTLAASPDVAVRLGKAGREKIEAGYCTQVTGPRLREILAQATRRAGAF